MSDVTTSEQTGSLTSRLRHHPLAALREEMDEMFGRFFGGFDDTFQSPASEDRELCDRWVQENRRLVYVPDAIVRHGHDLRLDSFSKQHFNYGRGAFNYHHRRAERGSGRMSDDFGFYRQLPTLLKEPLQRRSRGRALSILSLLVVWQIANATGYFFERVARSFRSRDSRES